jgi:hypothetical protein
MTNKLCCVLNSQYKCFKCPASWCYSCWNVGKNQGTHYTYVVSDSFVGGAWVADHERRLRDLGKKGCTDQEFLGA